jgi:hypothetical protein
MSNGSEAVKRWRTSTKQTLVAALGGCCAVCGYNTCNEALDLHHLDPDKKEFSFGKIIAHPANWLKIVKEAKKCVLLCANHHREYHAGICSLPAVLPVFDARFEASKTIANLEKQTPCATCGKLKPESCITCSRVCAAKRSRKVNWDATDLASLLSQKIPFRTIAKQLGISDVAVRKRAIKLNLIPI